MSVTKYGIYVAWQPAVDLRAEGLGRYLAAFLKGASARKEVKFVLVCPSWSQETLEQLFDSETVSRDQIQILSPVGKPYLLRSYEAYCHYSQLVRPLSVRCRTGLRAQFIKQRVRQYAEDQLAKVHNHSSSLTAVLKLIPLLLLVLLFALPLVLWAAVAWSLRIIKRYFLWVQKPFRWLARVIAFPKNDGWVLRIFDVMYQVEIDRMQHLIENLQDVKAWYCPTAFWPAFNNIHAPRLMCVPDVVLMDFSVGFAASGNDRQLQTFDNIQNAVRGADHIVTYSAAVKWKTLVDLFGMPATKISVVHHAPNSLDSWIKLSDTPDEDAATFNYCKALLLQALKKSSNSAYCSGFLNGEVQFLFYASQFRPNKNVLTLLRAYEYLLKHRLFSYKLILTGEGSTEIQRFIVDHHLENDVLCLQKLAVDELAACYKMATLAINPSLSEGGCPFTFNEALSVGTPVVTARIPVTQEILHNSELQDVMFFDPYDWKDMAKRIEWALKNRDQLLTVQTAIYNQLSKRTWSDVVNEHLDIMDDIACAAVVEITVAT